MMFDAVVIGAGPAGATAARLLARAGWSVAIVEKTRLPRRKVCGEFISATSLPLFDEPELREAFLAQAGPEIRRVGFFARETVLSSPMPAAANGVAAWGRALGREKLDTLLRDAAVRAGAQLWQPWKLTEVKSDPHGHRCTIASGERMAELTGRVLIAANGSWEQSPLSQSAAPAHRAGDLLAFKAHFENSELSADLMPLLVFTGGYGGMVHTDEGRVSLSCCIRRDSLAACRRTHPGLRAGDAVLAHIAASSVGVRDALGRARVQDAWLSAGPIRPGIRPRHSGGVFFAGNSAGEAHPIVAEGISMAMQSAWLLSRALLEAKSGFSADALAQAGRAYSAAWRKSFAPRIRVAALFAQLGSRPDLFAPALPLLERFPNILTWGAQFSGKATQIVAAPHPSTSSG